jgi:hypothetical protein
MEKRTSLFDNSNEVARTPTADLTAWLKQFYKIIINVEKNKAWQKVDVDLIGINKEIGEALERTLLELKVDRYHKKGNFCCETISNSKTMSIGCWYATKSDFIVYYFPGTRTVHIMHTIEAQEYVRKNESKFKTFETGTNGYKGEHWYDSMGFLVNIDEMKKHVYIQTYII